MLEKIDDDDRSNLCWVKPNEFCNVGSYPECHICIEALNLVSKKLKELHMGKVSGITHG